METWQKVAIVGGGFLAFASLPIWRTAEKGNLNLIEFLHHHSKYGDVPKEEKRWEDKEGYHVEWVYAERPS